MTHTENQRLTRVGAGTPMGSLMRRYWQPACLTRELAAGAAPVDVSLLGEELVAFRGPDGAVGLIDRYCPHRGVSLGYARNEPGGLRCIYHGWKVDADGHVVDIPNSRTPPGLRERICQPAYPVLERGGIIWAYLGPREHIPPFPRWPWEGYPDTQWNAHKVFGDCNWLQALEGSIDTSHINFLHRSDIRLPTADTEPDLRFRATPLGFAYAGVRRGRDGGTHVRYTHFALPCHVLIPPTRAPGVDMLVHQMWVPIDDTRHWFFTVRVNRAGPLTEDYEAQFRLDAAFLPARSRANRHLQDRDAMARGDWSGIEGVRSQDFAIVESAPPLLDRSREHLVAADAAIAWARRQLLGAVRTAEAGGDPPGVGNAEDYRTAVGDERTLPAGTDVWEAGLATGAARSAGR